MAVKTVVIFSNCDWSPTLLIEALKSELPITTLVIAARGPLSHVCREWAKARNITFVNVPKYSEMYPRYANRMQVRAMCRTAWAVTPGYDKPNFPGLVHPPECEIVAIMFPGLVHYYHDTIKQYRFRPHTIDPDRVYSSPDMTRNNRFVNPTADSDDRDDECDQDVA